MKVSVVIPVYNEEKLIEKCLESLMNQTVKADEIILVDNNSTDKTIERALSFPVRIIEEKKQGILPARNTGFDAAKYEIIARCDADSVFPKTWIERVIHDFGTHDIIGVTGPHYFYDLPMVSGETAYMTIYKMLAIISGHVLMIGSNMAFKKSAWEKVRNDICRDEKKIHEDLDLSYHAAKYGKIFFDQELVMAVSSRRYTQRPLSLWGYSYKGFMSLLTHRLGWY